MVYSCTKCHGSLHPVDEGAHWKCEDCNQVFSIDYLVGFVAGKMSAAKAMEKRGTDVQQLKQAIALVRRSAGLHLSIGEIDLCKGCLDLIEQRACI